MTTRAANIEFLLAGLMNATTGNPVSGGTVYFYAAGTTTPKYVWTEKEKTNGYYSYTLDEVGSAQLYGEGNYKLVVKDSAGATVMTLDQIRLEYPYYGIRSVVGTTSQTTQDDFLLVDTTSGAITINLLAAASWLRPLKVQRIAGAYAVTLDPSGSETIDGAATLTISSDAIVEVISDGSNLRSAGFRSASLDADGDTGIEVERTADIDKIYAKIGGVDKALLTGSADADDSYIKFNAHRDADGDTFIMVEETVDEDKIRASLGGIAKLLLSATGSESFIKFSKHSDQDGDTLVEVERTADIDAVYIQIGGVDRVLVDANALKVAPQSGVTASITGTTVSVTDVSVLAGGYVHTADLADLDSGMVKARSKEHATIPGTVSLYGTTGTQGTEGLRVLTDGKVNLPVGLQIGGVDLTATPTEVDEVAVGSVHTSFAAGGDLTGTVYIAKIGKMVLMHFLSLTHSSSTSPSSAAGAIPAAYRPTYSSVNTVYSAGVSLVKSCGVSTAGTITFAYLDWAGSLTADTSVGQGSIAWVIA